MKNYFLWLFIFHIFIITAIFLYVGFARSKTAIWLYYILGVIGLIIIIYHAYKLAFKPLKHIFWNYFHIFIIGPLLILTAFYRNNSPTTFYDIFIGLGAAAFVINVYFLVRLMKG